MYKFFIGTSGYSYEDWKGNFYPPEISSKEYLCYYSAIFNTVELNFTYYCLPNPFSFYNMCRKVNDPGNFIFSVKANSIFTHERDYCRDDVKKFTESLKPLADSGSLGSILFQFPYSFKFSRKNLDYILKIGNEFAGCEICAEFRNINWINEDTLGCLGHANIGFCNVDEPELKGLIPPTGISTSDTGYIRFHGRNKVNWWEHKQAWQRYDYMYSQEELAEWIPLVKEIKAKTKKAFIYFNNHYKGKAAKSALMFMDLLKYSNAGNGYTDTSQN